MIPQYYVGLMSGTSLDGIDAVLAGFAGGHPVCRAMHYVPFEEHIRAEALSLSSIGRDELHRAATLGNELAKAYAGAVTELLAQAGVTAKSVHAIGCHGQTVRHAPEFGYTLQLNNPALLAELTGIAVVSDFRSRDIAAGGQGAPLVPAFHDAAFRDNQRHRVILNIGGIANLTDLAMDQPTRGFDCGPGNMLLDAWAQRHLEQRFDAGGNWSRQGRTMPHLLSRLLSHPFLEATPPKSCGREQFNIEWLESMLAGNESAQDVQATLTEFTAATSAAAIRQHCLGAQEIYVCGGGAHNQALMALLREKLSECRVDTTELLGLPPDWVEAMAFAWLAHRHLAGEPANLPAVTGARGLRVLGALHPA